MNTRMVRTARGVEVRVFEHGASDTTPLVYLHGITGLDDDARFLELLSERHLVIAPELPGFGESLGEELLEDMLDFALHGWDVLTAVGVVDARPVLVGHSLGGMIAAEMVCLAPQLVAKLVLVDAFGLWLDAEPVPDIFALTAPEFMSVLYADGSPRALPDGTDPEALRSFLVANARRMGTAGKLLFPIPNRRVSKRLYRVHREALVVWGEQDRLMSPAYARRWLELLPNARVSIVAGAGHMLPYEQPNALARAIDEFAVGSRTMAPLGLGRTDH